MVPVRNVVFDFGGVLVRWAPGEVVASLFEPSVHERLMQESFQHPDWLEVDRGTLNEASTSARVAQRTGLKIGLTISSPTAIAKTRVRLILSDQIAH